MTSHQTITLDDVKVLIEFSPTPETPIRYRDGVLDEEPREAGVEIESITVDDPLMYVYHCPRKKAEFVKLLGESGASATAILALRSLFDEITDNALCCIDSHVLDDNTREGIEDECKGVGV